MIKRLLTICVIALSLSGCSTVQNAWDAYNMAKFDVNEYQYVARIRTHAQLGVPLCGTPEVRAHVQYIFVAAQEFQNYAEMIPNNQESYDLAVTLTNITDGFWKRYVNNSQPSDVYCKAKFSAIERASENIQKVIGAKPR